MVSNLGQLIVRRYAKERSEPERHSEDRDLGALACLEQQLPFRQVKEPVGNAKPACGGGAVEDEPVDPDHAGRGQALEGLVVFTVYVERHERGAAGVMLVGLVE